METFVFWDIVVAIEQLSTNSINLFIGFNEKIEELLKLFIEYYMIYTKNLINRLINIRNIRLLGCDSILFLRSNTMIEVY